MSYTMKDFDQDRARWLAKMQADENKNRKVTDEIAADWTAAMRREEERVYGFTHVDPNPNLMQILKWSILLGIVVFLVFFFVIGPALF